MSWTEKATAVYAETQKALQTVFDSLNQGQQKKLLNNEAVKALLEYYGVKEESL